jgi:hypothetical protein
MVAGCKHASPRDASSNSRKPKQAPVTASAPRRSIPAAAQPGSRITAVSGMAGRVALLNANLQYVVIDFSLNQLPEVDQRFAVFRQGKKVGEVKISGPVRDHNIVADIVAGEAKPGDEVQAF